MFRNTFILFSLGLLLFYSPAIFAQDRDFVQQLVNKLAAPEMHGRGYVKQGDSIAAELLAGEMHKAGLHHFGHDYFQPFRVSINTFPGKMDVKVNGQALKPGIDFTVSPKAQTTKGVFELLRLPDTLRTVESTLGFIDTTAAKGKLVVLPDGMQRLYRSGIPGLDGMVIPVEDKPWWFGAGARNPDGRLNIMIKKDRLPPEAETLEIDIESKYIENYPTRNLIGYVPGQVAPDHYFVFIAHYDHLGQMGSETFFPGANDNASGTAAVLDLARHYANNPEEAYYTMVFILVSAEEVGLVGSFYNAENPLFPLEDIKFLINFDMVGTGSEGLSVVNGKVLPDAFARLDSLNRAHDYFPDLRAGGESCNSDHCAYYRKGVPAFFLFTRGSEHREYHNVYDIPETLPFTRYEALFHIVTDFVKTFQPL